MAGKRDNCISWDAYFMSVALITRERSKDPKTQVGAVIVKENHIIATGYNGTPKGLSDDEMPWDSLGEKNGDLMNIKNSFVVHAEANAIESVAEKKDLDGATIYITLSPCIECAKRIACSHIKKVVYLEPYKKEEQLIVSNYILKKAGVLVSEYMGEPIYEVFNNILRNYQKSTNKEETLVKKLVPKN